jgi:hypothetical protein
LSGINPALREDVELFGALLRGENAIHGIHNQGLRQLLVGESRDPALSMASGLS